MIPNLLPVVEQTRQDFPEAWANAHTGNAHTEDFIRILARRCHAIDPHFGLNGKRGNPQDISDDALNYLGEGPGLTPEGLPCQVIDVIAAAGSPSAAPAWQPFSNPQDASGAWVAPNGAPDPDPAPEPPAPSFPPYPGDAVFDAIGVALFADYAQAGQPPNPQMGRWFGRVCYDWLAQVTPTLEASIVKHRAEWRAVLGLPPL